MSKSEEIINDWHNAKKIWLEKYPLSNLTVWEIVSSLMDDVEVLQKFIEKIANEETNHSIL